MASLGTSAEERGIASSLEASLVFGGNQAYHHDTDTHVRSGF